MLRDVNLLSLSVSVRQVLQTKAFINSNVIAGRNGLDRRISRITVSELPDTLDWIVGGELVCTTGYQLLNNPEKQMEWITVMEQLGVAALVIKPQRFFGVVPQRMIEISNELGLPLIELPNNIIWPAVIQSVMDLMLSIQTNRLQESYDIHHRLVRLVLSSSGLDSILRTISQMIACAVILEDRFFTTMSYYHSHDPLEAECARIRLSESTQSELRNNPGTGTPDDTHAVMALPLPLDTSRANVTQMMIPVVAGKNFFGWLTALPIKQEQSIFVETVLMHGSTAIALELLIQITSLQSRAYEMNSFFDMLSIDSKVSQKELIRQGSLFGINMSLPTCVFIIESRSEINLFRFHQIDACLKNTDQYAVVSFDKNRIIVLYHPKQTSNEKAIITKCRRIAKDILEITKTNEYTCNIGVGRCVPPAHTDMLKRSFQEAKECVRKAAKGSMDICSYDQLGIEKLFPMFSDIDELKSFARYTLKPLLEYDSEKNTELFKTLRVFLQNEFNKAKSAKDLCIHINTLNYRITKIQEILDLDFEDMESCLMLFLAIKVTENN